MKSWIPASRAAASISSSLASGFPKRMFSRSVMSNRKLSWNTTPIWVRSDICVTCAEIVAVDGNRAPPVGSCSRSSRPSSVLLPDPLGPTMATDSPARIVARHVSERRRRVAIAEAHVVQLDGAGEGRQRPCARPVGDLLVCVEHFLNPNHAAGGPLHRRDDAGQRLQDGDDEPEQVDHRDQAARRTVRLARRAPRRPRWPRSAGWSRCR